MYVFTALVACVQQTENDLFKYAMPRAMSRNAIFHFSNTCEDCQRS